MCPDLDTSTVQFRKLRTYVLSVFRRLKRDFLWVQLYGHILSLMKEYPEEIDIQNDREKDVIKWLKARFDSNAFKFIYGPKTSSVTDHDETFGNKRAPAFLYLQKIFDQLGVRMSDIIRRGSSLNPGIS
ncbi:hypothetical protein GGR53DRAFT_464918 [Hypoxylon sp. FL1150]|nr:hypothetical protein GGR53DRAFT_464918 [Hypoxylon sp. FL1150]